MHFCYLCFRDVFFALVVTVILFRFISYLMNNIIIYTNVNGIICVHFDGHSLHSRYSDFTVVIYRHAIFVQPSFLTYFYRISCKYIVGQINALHKDQFFMFAIVFLFLVCFIRICHAHNVFPYLSGN